MYCVFSCANKVKKENTLTVSHSYFLIKNKLFKGEKHER